MLNKVLYSIMKRSIFFTLMAVALFFPLRQMSAQTVSVTLSHDKTFTNETAINRMEANLGKLLNELNLAEQSGRKLILDGFPMTKEAKATLNRLWEDAHFFCDDSYVVTRLWNLQNSYMVRQIPLILTSRDTSTVATYQEAVVEFDANGTITDFMFSSYSQLGEGTNVGDPVLDVMRRNIILKYCDRFRTAYNTKDLNFLQQVFSEKALIITGSVVQTKSYDGKPITSIKYKKQDKEQYLANLKKAFERNAWIDVKFTQIGENGESGESLGITQSSEDPNIYGVRLRQVWKSSTYHDEGYVFLLWDFTDEKHPVIHVRTWQPEWVGGKKISDDELFGLSDFEGL